MTDGPQHFPPPGAPPPEEPITPSPAETGLGHPSPSAWTAYAGGNGPVPGLALGAAHKPGAFALRPLTLGAIYDGAFRIIRFNPKATVGAAVLVAAVSMLIPIIATAVVTLSAREAIELSGDIETDASIGDLAGLLVVYGALLLSTLLSLVGVTLVTGMIAHVTRAAAVGRRLDLAQAWAATRGKRWRLIGLTTLINLAFLALVIAYVLLWVVVVVVSPAVLVVLWAVVSVPAFLCLCCWLWIRFYYLPVPPLMLEDIGVLDAIGRGWTLTSRQFWRTFGIALLTVVIGQVGGSMLSGPAVVLGLVAGAAFPGYEVLASVVSQSIGTVMSSAFVTPFLASVASLQYVDLRMRKEALDVELMREAGVLG